MSLYITLLLHPVLTQGGKVGYLVDEFEKSYGIKIEDLLSRYGSIVYDLYDLDSGDYEGSHTPGIPYLVRIGQEFEIRIEQADNVQSRSLVESRFINTCIALLSSGCERVFIGPAYTEGLVDDPHAVCIQGEFRKLVGLGFNDTPIDIGKLLPE